MERDDDINITAVMLSRVQDFRNGWNCVPYGKLHQQDGNMVKTQKTRFAWWQTFFFQSSKKYDA